MPNYLHKVNNTSEGPKNLNNTSEGPKNVSNTLSAMENLANPNETKTEDNETKTEGNETSSMNATSDGDANAVPLSSNRVVMQPENVANNLFQRVSRVIHGCRGCLFTVT